jgi:hypothetical protein
MSAEGKPLVEDSALAPLLGFATHWVLRYPVQVLVSAIALALLSLFAASLYLEIHTSRLDLLDPHSHYNKRWLAYINEFGEEDDALIVVEGAGPETVTPVLEELAAAISREDQMFQAVLYKKDFSKIRAKGLYFLSVENLQQIDRLVARIEPVLRGDWSQLGVAKVAAAASQQLAVHPSDGPEVGAAHAELFRICDSLSVALADPQAYRSPWPQMTDLNAALGELDADYLLSNEGRLGFVLLAISREGSVQGSQAIDQLRRLIANVQRRHGEVRIGLTGMQVLEIDEMRASQSDMIQASLLSLVGVSCLFIAGFGGLRYPLMTVATLLLGMAWSFGYITLAVGHLNILSVAFGVILIGLGIDFGIHYVARYLQIRRTIPKSAPALIATARSIGPGIITGAVTTALAFFTAALTRFTGVAELGIVAGGGILLCLLTALLVLPAFIHLSDQQRTGESIPTTLPLEKLLEPVFRYPRVILFATVSLTALLAVGALRLRYDHNLLNLQPTDLESVELERDLLTNSDRSVWFALSVSNSPQQLRQRKLQFEKLACVDRTEEIVSLLPDAVEQKAPLISGIRQRLAVLPERVPLIPTALPEQLELELTRAQRAFSGSDSQSHALRQRMQQVCDQLHRLPRAECFERLSRYQQRMAAELVTQLRVLNSIAEPEPPSLDDVPESLRTRFVGRNQRHLLKVYARGNVWDMHNLERFVKDVERVDPVATGHPVQTYYASRQMQQSYLHAAYYSLLALGIVLMLDFRSISHSLLAMFPLGLGMVQLFGLLGLLDIPLNPANMIVLPLILGIGIDNGVHIVHDFRSQTGRYRLSRSTATAVVITSATTMVGFGSMMFAKHQGLRSLGQVLTIGVFCCLCASVVMLPALLSWLTRKRLETHEDQDQHELSIARFDALESNHRGSQTQLARPVRRV